MGATGPTHTQPLKKEKAVEVGAEIIGEAFIYTVAASFVLFEYWRSGQKEASMEAKQDRDINALNEKYAHLDGMLAKLEDRIKSLENKCLENKK